MYTASDGRYTLCVEQDTYVESPRAWSNLGTMVCFHDRYALGDDHPYGEPLDFLRDVYEKTVRDDGKALVAYLKSGQSRYARLGYNRQTHLWDLTELYGRFRPEWIVTQSATKAELHAHGRFWQDMLDSLAAADFLHLLGELPDFVILPLYLYDHSGLAMSTGSFGDPWDSGQVGWIYADGDTVRREYGKADPESVAKVTATLVGEVEAYAHFLQGNCWHFTLYENGAETVSCGGFIGDVEDCGIGEYLPEDAAHLVGELTWTNQRKRQLLCA